MFAAKKATKQVIARSSDHRGRDSAERDSLKRIAWVPGEVFEIALRMETAGVTDKALLERPLYDERMKRVWSGLNKKQRNKYRKTEKFVHQGASSFKGQARNVLRQAAELKKRSSTPDRAVMMKAEAALLDNLSGFKTYSEIEGHEAALGKLLYDAYHYAVDTPIALLSNLESLRAEFLDLSNILVH